jgi:hypothetical protein
MQVLGLSRQGVQKIIAKGYYKKHPLATRRSDQKKGKPAYYVLWDITTNQPATKEAAAEGAAHVEIITHAVKRPVNPVMVGSGGNLSNAALPAVSDPAPTPLTATPAVALVGGLPPSDPLNLPPSPNVLLQTQTVAIFPRKDMGVTPDQMTAETPEEVPEDFETLLFRKVQGKPASTQRSMRSYYRKLYAATGEIPCALFVEEGRRFAGKKSTLDMAIQSRFIDMVMKSADQGDIFNYYTQDQRKVTVFHDNLEQEFGRKIPINQLYSIVRSCNLRRYLEMPDSDTDTQKMPGFFKAEPVGALVQMDGVEADYFEIMVAGKWRKPIWIEFMDLGSRKLLAMYAYLSESSENSVDIFCRFLRENAFAQQAMKIRPDQAGGFRNLKRPIKELNNRYAMPDGFLFIDDFARAGTPKDKAHLESSHRAAHKTLERSIINHFTDRIVGQYKKQKKTGTNMRTVTVTQLNISLDDLNQSGMTEAYMARHNGERHRFTEDGTQRTWVPDDRWQNHLASVPHFRFKPEDIELCKIYGHPKAAATISKDGTITYQKQKFYVENTDLWSRSSPTKVKVSLIDGGLAIFKDDDEGIYRGKAKALQAPVRSEKLADKEKAKVAKIHIDNEQHNIIFLLKEAKMIVNEEQVRHFISLGLTLAITSQLLLDNSESYAKKPNTIVPFHLFSSDVKKYLAATNKTKLLPYAEVG